MKPTQQDIDEFYSNMGHVHTGSTDWRHCHICNPLLPKPKPIAYIYDCIQCNEQFLSKKKRKKKKRVCKNCKQYNKK